MSNVLKLVNESLDKVAKMDGYQERSRLVCFLLDVRTEVDKRLEALGVDIPQLHKTMMEKTNASRTIEADTPDAKSEVSVKEGKSESARKAVGRVLGRNKATK